MENQERSKTKFILAPMATLSHEAFRCLVMEFGYCDEYFNEMINAPSLLHNGPFEKFYLLNDFAKEKIVWQLTGTEKSSLSEAAAVLCSYGGKGIDLNMGCSAPQIYCTGAGISWMTKPIEETQKMVHEVKSAIENNSKDGKKSERLSVKLRLGDEDFTVEKFFDFTDMLVGEGVEMLTLHPRTKKEKVSRPPRWNFVELLSERYPEIPVILNGNVKDKNSFLQAKKAAPSSSGIMIGRAAAQKPWIFKELAGEKFTVDCQKVALDFIDNVEKFQPEEFFQTRLQRFFAYYCLNFSFAHFFHTKMLNSKSIEESRKLVIEYFEQMSDDRFIKIE